MESSESKDIKLQRNLVSFEELASKFVDEVQETTTMTWNKKLPVANTSITRLRPTTSFSHSAAPQL